MLLCSQTGEGSEMSPEIQHAVEFYLAMRKSRRNVSGC
jgi:hypothetical protein